MDIWPAVIQLYNHFLWKISSNSHGVNPRPLHLSLLLLNNISNPILTSTRSQPFHFNARDWEPIYSTKRRLNIGYWGSSTLEPVRTLPLSPPRTSNQFTLFSLSPIPKLLRAIPPPPPPKATRGSAMHVFLVTLVLVLCTNSNNRGEIQVLSLINLTRCTYRMCFVTRCMRSF